MFIYIYLDMITLIFYTLSWHSQAETESEVTIKLNGVRGGHISIKCTSLLNKLVHFFLPCPPSPPLWLSNSTYQGDYMINKIGLGDRQAIRHS